MAKRHKSCEISDPLDPSPPIPSIFTTNLLIPQFTTIPAHLIYEYAREWSGERTRTWLMAMSIDEWVAPNRVKDETSENLIFFTQPNNRNIYQLDLFQSSAAQISILFHAAMVESDSQPNSDIIDSWKQDHANRCHLIMLYPSHSLIQWNSKYILEFKKSNKSVNIIAIDPGRIVHCFPLLNNQYVVCSAACQISVRGLLNPPSIRWFAMEQVRSGCVISERTFAVSYRNFCQIDIWNIVGERLRTIDHGWEASSIACLDGKLAIGSKVGLEILNLNIDHIVFPSFETVKHIEPMGNNRFACIFSDTSITIYDGQKELTLDKENPITKCLWLSNEYLVMLCGNEVTLWE